MRITLHSGMNQERITELQRIAEDGARMARAKAALIDAAGEHPAYATQNDALFSVMRKAEASGLTKILRERRTMDRLAEQASRGSLFAVPPGKYLTDAASSTAADVARQARKRISPGELGLQAPRVPPIVDPSQQSASPAHAYVTRNGKRVRLIDPAQEQQVQLLRRVVSALDVQRQRAERAERGERSWRWIALIAPVVTAIGLELLGF